MRVNRKDIANQAAAILEKKIRYKTKTFEVARELAIGQKQLEQYFKETFGVGVYEYQKRLKAEHAKKLLLDGSKVRDVATYTGYSFESNFIKAFRDVVGDTPHSWAKKQLEFGKTA